MEKDRSAEQVSFYHVLLENIRIFTYYIVYLIVPDGNGKCMKGYLSIQEISYKWRVSRPSPEIK